jgi:threonyl-tRNA synthetase
VQLDYVLPERFKLEFIGPDNRPHRPVMIHRAPFGSMERFMGILIEQYGGAFPMWLAPVQVTVMSISEKFNDYARKVATDLGAAGIRVHSDFGADKIGAKIRRATLDKIPYMLIIGEKEQSAGAISVRTLGGEDRGQLALADFVREAKEEIDSRKGK